MSAGTVQAPGRERTDGNRGGSKLGKYGPRAFALTYLALLLFIPVVMIFYRTVEEGFFQSFESIMTPDGWHAFWLSLLTVLIAVPLNTAFGVLTAIVLVRHRFRGKSILNLIVDIPFAVSPVVIGLSLLLLYGPRTGWFGQWLFDHGIQVIFSVPGIVLACVFVSLPFVVREVAPVLQEIGDDAEQAAATLGASPWQQFWRITLPALRWGVIYGVVLSTARVLGEFGAVSVVSGRISGKTETLPLIVEKQFGAINPGGAYAASMVLAVMALITLLAMNLLRRGKEEKT